MGVLANALSNVHSAVLGDFKGAAGRAAGVSVEADPRDPEKKVLRFGKGKDDIFPVEGGGPAVEGMRKIFSKWIESPSQLQKIRDLPLEDRPVLMFEYTGLATGGYCNGERIVLNPVLGTGYSAAGILAHEFQHQYQFKKNENGIDGVKKDVNRSEAVFADRMMEAAADAARAQYLYEIKDKNPQTKIAFYESALQEPYIFKYAAAKDKGFSESYCVLQGMKAYAGSIITQAMYEKEYNSDIDYKKGFVARDLDQFADNVLDNEKKRAEGLAGYFLDGEKLDEVKAFHSYTVGMKTEQADAGQITRAMRSENFDYVTPIMAAKLQKLADLYKRATGKEHKNAPENLTVRSLTGHVKNGKGSFLTKMALKAQKLIEKAGDSAKKVKYGIVSDHSVASSFGYYDKGRRYISFDGANASPEEGKNRISYQAEFGKLRDSEARELISEKEIKARDKKARQMFSILMKDPLIKAQLQEFGGDGKQMTLAFDARFKQPFTTDKNVVVLDPSKKPFELAADFAAQLQIVQQHEKAKEVSGVSSYAAYKKDAELNRDPVQVMQEKRMCQAMAETAKASFLYRNQDQAGFFDRLKLKKNKVFQTFASAMKKDPAQAVTTAVREAAKTFDVDAEGRGIKRRLDRYMKEEGTGLPAEKIDRLMTVRVSDAHIAAVACAGQFSERNESKIADNTMQRTECCAITQNFAEGLYAAKTARQKYAAAQREQSVHAAEKVNLQQKLHDAAVSGRPSMMQQLRSRQNAAEKKTAAVNVAAAKARTDAMQK